MAIGNVSEDWERACACGRPTVRPGEVALGNGESVAGEGDPNKVPELGGCVGETDGDDDAEEVGLWKADLRLLKKLMTGRDFFSFFLTSPFCASWAS